MAQKQYANKRDANEPEIVEALKLHGASVIQMDKLDLIVGYKGKTHVMEIKNPNTSWELKPSQKKLINSWVGSPIHIVTTKEQAINIVENY